MDSNTPTAEFVIIEIYRAQRGRTMYPEGHPSLIKSFETAYGVLQEFLTQQRELDITLKKEGLFHKDTPLNRGNEVIKNLAQDMNMKSVFSLTFKNGLTFEEFNSFMNLFAMEHSDFRNAGGALHLFNENGIKQIIVREADFDGLTKEGYSEEEEIAGEEPKAPEVEIEDEDDEDDNEELDDEIADLLILLAKETNPNKIKKVLIDIIKLSGELAAQEKYSFVLKMIIAVAKEAHPRRRRPKEIQQMCIKTVRKCASEDVINVVLENFGTNDDKTRNDLVILIKVIGEESIPPTLELLSESSDSVARRNLIKLIISFGELARPKVEILLLDERWYVVRNMANILGEIKSEKSLNSLSRIMNHDEARVQREVIKALTKIGGKNVAIFFLRMLQDASQQLTFILINSLGALGDPIAVEPLTKIAITRNLFYRNFEVRREAINSLARLGNQGSVDTLGKILLKREFIGGIRNEELRINSAKALGRLGGESATTYLFKATKNRNKNIRKASIAALKELGIES